jgi:SOS-response transcriptional repressor LexA
MAKQKSSKKDSSYATDSKIAQGLKALRNRLGLTQRELAQELGVTPGAVGQWESGKIKPSNIALRAIIGIAGEDRDWWVDQAEPGDALVIRSVDEYKKMYEVNEDKNKTFFIHGSAGAGPNIFVPEHAEDKVSLPRSWFHRVNGIKGLWVRGDSMSPLIADGFLVLVDVKDNKDFAALDGKIVAARDSHGVCIKWLRKQGDAYYLVSHNISPEYPPILVIPGEHSIVGTVQIWVGGLKRK